MKKNRYGRSILQGWMLVLFCLPVLLASRTFVDVKELEKQASGRFCFSESMEVQVSGMAVPAQSYEASIG